MRLARSLTRAVAAATLVALAGCGAAQAPVTPVKTGPPLPSTASVPHEEFAELEREFSARLGVYAVDTGSGREVTHRAGERFAFASTIKALLAGAVLRQRSLGGLGEVLTYTADDLVSHSPVTERHAGAGMPVRALLDAAVRYSDNTAANVLLDDLGGPEALTAALREIGDDTTRSDRYETELNTAVPGDVRDTSTPRAMATSLRVFVLGDALPPGERAFLTELLRTNTTGDTLIRAGVPAGWPVGDKTGAGGYGTRNDIAVVWPPGRDPIVLAVLSDRDSPDASHDDALVARAAEVVVGTLR
ncbi:beta-lactamase class A [Prauserella shujinwangii]|uniref:Beta-lactamase n=1 Tax=Prauserella shujinwangii TaxID=1453103 RepID=A0A2T0M1G3_9PSEU|nr:class A beta-lactamase [Prauserella shujinwangii]PRX50425.1 beta-lactamase class A [Prauserella shujinwangii]